MSTIVLREGEAECAGIETVVGWSTRFAGAIITVFDIGSIGLVRCKKKQFFHDFASPGLINMYCFFPQFNMYGGEHLTAITDMVYRGIFCAIFYCNSYSCISLLCFWKLPVHPYPLF